MKYQILNVKLINYETVENNLETDSNSGKINCDLIISKTQYENCKLNIGTYFKIELKEL